METRMERRLHRSRVDRMVFGVCGGLGEYFEIDPVLIRLGFVLVTLAGGAGVLAYIVLAIVLPEADAPAVAGRAGLRSNLESLQANVGELAGEVRTGVGGAADTAESTASGQRGRQLIGLVLIGLGVLFLANMLGWLTWWSWHQLWPLVLVVLGLAILWRQR